MSNEQKTLTITLTGRNPVQIDKEKWPILAHVNGDSGGDYGHHQQALRLGECDRYRLTVRQHADGRSIVYGVLDAAIAEWGAGAGGESVRGGELLDPRRGHRRHHPARRVVLPPAGRARPRLHGEPAGRADLRRNRAPARSRGLPARA
jgi:hypothetical protein